MSTQIKSHKNQDVIVTKHRAHMNNILSRNSMYQFTLNSQQSQCLKTRKDNPDSGPIVTTLKGSYTESLMVLLPCLKFKRQDIFF